MSEIDSKLCAVCGKRQATHHITTVVSGIKQFRDICRECFVASGTQTDKESEALAKTAYCAYCGCQPCNSVMDHLALAMGIQQVKFMCMTCWLEYLQHTQQELARVPQGLTQQEQQIAIQAVRDETDMHMRRWVSRRKEG